MNDFTRTLSNTENLDQKVSRVVDKGKYIGFISRSNMLSYYRKVLKKSATLF